MPRRSPAGAGAEDEQLRERVRAQTVGTVDGDARCLPRGVETIERSLPGDVGGDPAHHVVHHRPDGDRLMDRVDADVVPRQLPDEGEILVNQLLPEVPEVQVDVVAVGPFERPPLLMLLDMAARKDISRPQFHLAMHRRVRRRTESVILEVSVAVLVLEMPTLAAGSLRDEDAGSRQPRRVVLDELHVLQRNPGAVGERHAVPGLDGGVGREWEDPPGATGAHDHRFGRDRAHLPVVEVQGRHTTDLAVFNQQRGREPLVVARDLRVLERGLEEGMEHVEAGLVGGVERSVHGHAAEGARAHAPVGSRLHGQPQCSSWITSPGASLTNASTTSWSARKSLPKIVSFACVSRLSFSRMTAAVPPSADTVWLRMGYTFESTAMDSRLDSSAAAIAARRPAPPPPITSRSGW